MATSHRKDYMTKDLSDTSSDRMDIDDVGESAIDEAMDNEEFEDNESQDDEGGNWDNDDVMDDDSEESDEAPEVPPHNLPLSNDLCDKIFAEPYDVYWLEKWHIDGKVVCDFTSPKKLESLMAPVKVIKVGDKLVLVERFFRKPDAEPEISRKEAIVSAFGAQGKRLPDFSLYVDGEHVGELKDCHGPSKIVEAFNEINPREASRPVEAWHEIELVRDGFRVDWLHDVRNAFHLWEELKADWERRKQNLPPIPKGPRKKWDYRDGKPKRVRKKNRQDE